MGVITHIENDDLFMKNISLLVRPGGVVLIGFRNKLFSLFTYNRYTADFILNDLLKNVNKEVKKVVAQEIEPKLRMDLSPTIEENRGEKYSQIVSRFHNPFEVSDLFERNGLIL